MVSNIYSICIDKCIPIISGIEKSGQVVIRYKKLGCKYPYQPTFDEFSITKAIINAYKEGDFSLSVLQELRKGISEID